MLPPARSSLFEPRPRPMISAAIVPIAEVERAAGGPELRSRRYVRHERVQGGPGLPGLAPPSAGGLPAGRGPRARRPQAQPGAAQASPESGVLSRHTSSPAWRAITALIRGVAQGKVGQKQPTFAAVTVREPEVTSPTPPRAQRRRLSRAVSVQPTGPSPPSPPGTRMPPICRIVCAPGGC